VLIQYILDGQIVEEEVTEHQFREIVYHNVIKDIIVLPGTNKTSGPSPKITVSYTYEDISRQAGPYNGAAEASYQAWDIAGYGAANLKLSLAPST